MAYYAVQATVLSLCQNSVSNPGDLYPIAAQLVNTHIDATLSNYFYWPYDNQDNLLNDPPPDYVVQMANFYTASVIESIQYAQSQGYSDISLDSGGPSSNTTYGRWLYGTYKQLRNELVKGIAMTPELVRYSSIGAQSACPKFHLTLGLANDVGFAQQGSGPGIDGSGNE